MIDFSAFDNISDELLAAYIDGNTTVDENALIQSSLASDELLSEVVDIANDNISFGGYDWGIHDGDYGFLELGLPPVITPEDMQYGMSKEITAAFESHDTSINPSIEDLSINCNTIDESFNNSINEV